MNKSSLQTEIRIFYVHDFVSVFLHFKLLLTYFFFYICCQFLTGPLYSAHGKNNINNNNNNKNSAEGYVAPGKEHESMVYNCNSYS